jgi:bifunctional DNA-binding transcriptional regulator/antitoxin component of YhaV-PrlF toxin-antitoxin module
MFLPLDILEKIGNYCDIDTRRHMGLKPGKIKIPTCIKLLNYKQSIEIHIVDTDKKLIINRYPDFVTYVVIRDYFPTASRHLVYYNKEGIVEIYVGRDECL